MIRIVVPVWGDYWWVLDAFVHLARKYWRPCPPIIVVCHDPPAMPGGVEAFDAGGGWSGELYNKGFTGGIKRALEAMAEPVVYFSGADAWILGDVPAGEMDVLAEHLFAAGNVAKLKTGDPLAEPYLVQEADWGGYAIVHCEQPERHGLLFSGTGMMAALWNRRLFVELLQPGWTMWNMEISGSHWMHANRPELTSLGVRPGPIMHANAVRAMAPGVGPGVAFLGALKPEDRAVVEPMVPACYRKAE